MQEATPLGRSLTRKRKAFRVGRAIRSCALSHGGGNARDSHAATVGRMALPGGADCDDRWLALSECLRDVGYGLRNLERLSARRSIARRNCSRVRSDKGGVVAQRAGGAGPRGDAPVIPGNAEGRRTRISPTVPRQIAEWLRRVVHVHAQLCHTVAVYGDPTKAGGGGQDEYTARAAAGDRTILDDTLARAIEELTAIRDEVWREMGDVPPSRHRPGSPEKIATLRERFEAGKSLHHDNDSKVS